MYLSNMYSVALQNVFFITLETANHGYFEMV